MAVALSQGQVGALFRVKHLQPCRMLETAECYTLIAQGLAMYYVCDYASYVFLRCFSTSLIKHFLNKYSSLR